MSIIERTYGYGERPEWEFTGYPRSGRYPLDDDVDMSMGRLLRTLGHTILGLRFVFQNTYGCFFVGIATNPFDAGSGFWFKKLRWFR